MYKARWSEGKLDLTVAGQPTATMAVITLHRDGRRESVSKALNQGIGHIEIACRMPERVFVDILDGGKILAFDSLFVQRKLLNAFEVINWFKRQGIGEMIVPEEMHVTVCYSKEKMFWSVQPDTFLHEVPQQANRMVEMFGEACVLRFDCGYLDMRHQTLRAAGASSDFPNYAAHITLRYGRPAIDMGTLMPFCGPLLFGPELFAPIGEYEPVMKARSL